ncbi:uncharacterized protein UTRI_00322 [Ustilago trichophora]|uniref:Golgi apparatus membrane protein TVP38 n=1 Tax=Ustilago trichophora TaxID=86804 RepID=A0A5C3DR77_9BASI|nr:uncharacterized protein UTRI_00322 [Ustilago trichophora]
MSNPYYPTQPQRQPAYDNPLNPPYGTRNGDSRQPFPNSSSSQVNILRNDHDGIDYHHYHHPPPPHSLQPYHDPYATLTPNDERNRPVFSNENLMRSTSAYSKDMHNYASDDGHDQTMRGTHYMLAKDEESGRVGYGRGHRIEATDGLLPDVPPDMDRLNAEQKEIMKQFPPDLDDEGGGKSGLQAAKHLLKDWKSWFKLKYLHWWIMLIVVIAIVALSTIYHRQIVDWLTPISKKVTTVAWGWIIPVAILFIISFPPLFGHEIVLILVGLVYGIWIGFGIASLGTLLGEIGNFYAFKHCLRSMAANYERKNIHYACMAEMVRDGGFWVMFLARLSAIPGHFTTAVFATVGMNIFIFTFAAIIALPKQLLIVYLGVAIKNSGNGTEDTKSKIIKYVVLVISFIITVWTAYWLYQNMEKIRPGVSARLRQKRYELLLQARTPGTEGFSGQRVHSYPPTAGGGRGGDGGGGFDASYGYRNPAEGADETYNQHQADFSTDTYDPSLPSNRRPIISTHPSDLGAAASGAISPMQSANEPSYSTQDNYNPPENPHSTTAQPVTGGRQPIVTMTQFHRPLRKTSTPSISPTSPFQDPPTHPHPSTDGILHRNMAPENVPLTNAQGGEWASNSSLALTSSPIDAHPPPPPPPDYATFAPSSTNSHMVQQHPIGLQPRGGQGQGSGSGSHLGESKVDPTVQRYHLSD